jgi:hypothetical protein
VTREDSAVQNASLLLMLADGVSDGIAIVLVKLQRMPCTEVKESLAFRPIRDTTL